MDGSTLVLVGSALAALGAFGSVAVAQHRSRKIQIAVAGLTLVGAFISSFGVRTLDREAGALQSRLAQRTEEVLELTGQLAQTVTGDGGFCFLQPMFDKKQESAALLSIHRGTFPIYDLNIRIFDSNREYDPIITADMVDQITITWEDMIETFGRTIQVGNVFGNNEMRVVDILDLQGRDNHNYNIFFTARNGHWSQNLHFTKSNDQRHWAQRTTHWNGQHLDLLHWSTSDHYPQSLLPWSVTPPHLETKTSQGVAE